MDNLVRLLESIRFDGVVLSGIDRESILRKKNSDLDLLLDSGSIEKITQTIGRSFDVFFDIKIKSPQHVLALLSLGGATLELLDLFGVYNFVDQHGSRWKISGQLHASILKSHRKTCVLNYVSPANRLILIGLSVFLKAKPVSNYMEEVSLIIDRINVENGYEAASPLECQVIAMIQNGKYQEQIFDDPDFKRLCLSQCQRLGYAEKISGVFEYFRFQIKKGSFVKPFCAVIGLDGSGKSTFIKDLESNYPGKLKVIYWGSRNSFLPTSRWIHRRVISNERKGLSPEPEQKDYTAKQNYSRLQYFVYLLLSLNKYCEYLAKHIVSDFYRRLGFLVVADRHAVDELVEVNNIFYRSSRFVYGSFFPMPDQVILMKSSPEVIHSRRPSITADQAQFYNERYLEACLEIKAPSILLNGERNIRVNRQIYYEGILKGVSNESKSL